MYFVPQKPKYIQDEYTKMNILENAHKSQLNSQKTLEILKESVDQVTDALWIAALNQLFHMSYTFKRINTSQSYLGNKVGRDRTTLSRWTTKFHELGILTKVYHHRHACTYIINPLIFRFASLFKEKFWALKTYISRQLSKAAERLFKKPKFNPCTPYKYNNIIYLQERETSYGQSRGDEILDTSEHLSNKNKLKTQEFFDEVFGKSDTEVQNCHITPLISQKGELMNEEQFAMTPTLQKVSQLLNLTLWGKIKLSIFPDEALNVALADFIRANPYNPFKWFFDACKTYCEQNDIRIGWSEYYELRDQYGMPSKPLFIKKEGNTITNQSQSLREFKKVTLADIRDLPQFKSTFQMMDEEQDEETTNANIEAEYHKFETLRPQISTKFTQKYGTMKNPFYDRYSQIRVAQGEESLPEQSHTVKGGIFPIINSTSQTEVRMLDLQEEPLLPSPQYEIHEYEIPFICEGSEWEEV